MSLSEDEKNLDPTLISDVYRLRMEALVGYTPDMGEEGPLADLERLVLEVATEAELRGMERMWTAIADWYSTSVESGKDINIEGAVLEGLLHHMRIHHNEMPEQIKPQTMRELEVIGNETIPESLPVIPHWVQLLPEIKEKYKPSDQTSPQTPAS